MKRAVIVVLSLGALVLVGCSRDAATENGINKGPGALNAGATSTDNNQNGQTLGGPAGNFFGYIQKVNDAAVPLGLTLVSKTNEGGSSTTLHGVLRVGVFGGVTLGTDAVTYEWDSGQITVTFGSGNALVTLTGFVKNGVFENAVIKGNQSGIQPIVLTKDSEPLFDESHEEDFKMTFAGSGASGEMSVTTQFSSQPSSLFSDLSEIPLLGVSVRFGGMAVTPNNADKVLYDPLMGKLDVIFSNGGRLHFDDVALRSKNSRDVVLNGQVMAGSAVVDTVHGQVAAKVKIDASHVAPIYYFGTLRGVDDHLSYPLAAMLEYRGQTGSNPAEDIFPSFPMMSLTIYICGDHFSFGRMVFDLVHVNPVSGTALWRETKGDQKIDYQSRYTGVWDSITGAVRSSRSSSESEARVSKIDLKSVSPSVWNGCLAKERAKEF